MNRDSTLLPILVAIFALGLYGAMDGLMKAASIAMGPYDAMFWRGLAGVAMMVPLWLARARRRGWPDRRRLRLHALRSAVGAAMAVLYFYGLVRTPLAEAIALSFIAPLVALYLAVPILGERVSERAIGGSVVAILGVAVIAQGKFAGHYDAESIKGLVAILASAMLYAVNLVLQRRQAQLAAPEEIAFFQALFVTAYLGLGAPWLAPPPPAAMWPLLAGAALLAAAALMLLGWAYARADAQTLVPMEYTAFAWAVVVGWAMFDETPGWRTLAGVVLIVAGCLYAARRTPPRAPRPA